MNRSKSEFVILDYIPYNFAQHVFQTSLTSSGDYKVRNKFRTKL